jgi:hypothetical protein
VLWFNKNYSNIEIINCAEVCWLEKNCLYLKFDVKFACENNLIFQLRSFAKGTRLKNHHWVQTG